MKLIELCRAAGLECPEAQRDVEISSVTSDSRSVKEGSLFVCLEGTKTDGNLFAGQAKARGAAAVLSDKRRDTDLFSPDAHLSLAHLCRKFYGEGIEKLSLVGITGTNGKTTVTALLRSIFSAAGESVGSIGTLGCIMPNGETADNGKNMTTPDPEMLYLQLSDMAKAGARYVITEASSHALAKKKLDALHFDVGIFTNLSRDHLDFHKSQEEYFAAKSRLVSLCEKMIVNRDDEYCRRLENTLGCSMRRKSDFFADGIEYYGTYGCGYRFCSEYRKFGIVSKIPGRFTVMNTLEAASAATLLGVEPYAIKRGIYDCSAVSGRMERVALDGADFSVYIDYAHTPDALENLLLTAKGFAGRGRIVLLFGCGGDRDRGKRAQMAQIASRLADKIIITSDNSRGEDAERIFEDILEGIDKTKNYEIIKDRAEAIEEAVLTAKSADVILLAGKGHEKYEIDTNGKHFFDEVQTVKSAYNKRNGK